MINIRPMSAGDIEAVFAVQAEAYAQGFIE